MADKQTLGDKEADLQALARLVLESTEVTEALTKAIQATCDTLLRRLEEPVVPGLQGSLDEILQVMRAEKQQHPLNHKRLVGIGLGLVLLSGVVGWSIGQTTARVVVQRARLMEGVHAVLIERPALVPAELKAKIVAVYAQHGFARELLSPPPQKGGKP
jgi:hypothetical protein